MNKIRKGDDVIVITGRDKGKRGKVAERATEDRLIVDGVNIVNDQAVFGGALGHFAALALVATRDHDDVVAFANLVHGRSLQNFGRQGHDLHELLGAQFARHGSEDAGADGLQLGVEQHCCVAVEFDQCAVRATNALGRANHHCAVNLAFFDAATGSGFFDSDFDDVAHAGVTALRAAEHLDAHHGFGTRVVGNIESRLRLNHLI